MNRREFLRGVAGGFALATSGLLLPKGGLGQALLGPKDLPEGALEGATLERLPGKKPLIKKTYRPPNYETPVMYFNEALTPTAAFFIRYHLSNIPRVDVGQWKLRIGGDAAKGPLELTMADLKRDFAQVEVVALGYCSGNRRGLSKPHVPGIQWGYGAMGNARWRGVRLKDVLSKAGIEADALEVVLDGADRGFTKNRPPDFIKSLPLWKALDENTMIAYEMNGEPLPHWHGFPARLIVPGWTATYWVKHLTEINVVSKPFAGFWMKTAYRIPKGKFPLVDRFLSQETPMDTPITEMVVGSLITNLEDGQTFKQGQAVEVKGVAWDGGYGIKMVETSVDGGKTWQEATLGEDYGRFSWRQWSFAFKPPNRGQYEIMAKATNSIDQTQAFELIWNPAGYHHNVVQKITVNVA